MKPLYTLLTALLTITGISCKKVIQINLNSSNPQTVITAEVTDGPGPYQLSIYQSVNFSDPNSFPPVSGAKVVLRDNQSLVDTLVETSPGIYLTHSFWQGKSGNQYTIQVLSLGKTYEAVSTMPQRVPLDSVGFYDDNVRGSQTIIEPIPYFQDPPGVPNYYQFLETINDTALNKLYIYDDQFSDGRYIHQPLFDDSSHSHLQVNDRLLLTMYCIDAAAFNYLNTLQQVTSDGNFQSVTPANPITNWSGGALGYFSAHTVESKSVIVK